MKELACKDLGQGCEAVLRAPTEERLIDMVAVHVRNAHGVQALSQEQIAAVRNHMINRASSDAARVVDRIFEKYNCSGEPECTWRYIAEAETILNGGIPVHERDLKTA